MASTHYGLDITKNDVSSRYSAAEINQVHQIIDSQLNGALQMLGPGIQDSSDYIVTAATGLNVSISAGSAVVSHSAYGGIFLQTNSPTTLLLPASSTSYVFVLAVVDGSASDSRSTGTPIFTSQLTNTLDGALLLAQVVTSGSAVSSIADMRALELGSAVDMFDQDNDTTVGLTWGYKGGSVRNGTTVTAIAAGTLALTGSATNYVEVDPVGGTISVNSSAYTAGKIPVRLLTTNTTAITGSTDKRTWFTTSAPTGSAGGILGGTYPNPTGASTAANLILAGPTSGGAAAAAYRAMVSADIPSSVALAGSPTTTTQSASDNSTKIATTAYADAAVALAVTGLLDFKGSTDCSANPNYPAASKGDAYIVTVAGKIGGASGTSVDIGDVYVASADNAGGTQASVGSSWFVLEHNLVGALLTSNALSELSGVASTARSNIGAAADAAVVHLSGTETITGHKSFTPPVNTGLEVTPADATTTGAVTQSVFKASVQLNPAADSATSFSTYWGTAQTAVACSNNFSSPLVGYFAEVFHKGSGTASDIYGGGFNASANAGSGLVTNLIGCHSNLVVEATAAATAVYGYYVGLTNSGTVGTFTGFFSASSSATADYGVYCLNAKNYLSGQLGIGTNAPAASAAVDITSTTQGFLPPRMTTTQRTTITAAEGLIVYDTTLHQLWQYQNSAWAVVGAVTSVFGRTGAVTATSGDYTAAQVTNAVVSTGVSGGQTISGGTAASETLTLASTAHATKGKILFGTSAYDGANNRLGIATASPTYTVDVVGITRIAAGTLADTGNQALAVSATIATTTTAARLGAYFAITTAGSSSFDQQGLAVDLLAGYTGTSICYGLKFQSNVASSGQVIGGAFTSFGAAAANVGVSGRAQSGTNNIGVFAGLNIAPFTASAAIVASSNISGKPIMFGYNNTTIACTISQTGQAAFATTAAPTANLLLGAGTATANTAPLKFTSGTVLGTPEAGTMEYDGTHVYVTTGSTRYQIDNAVLATVVSVTSGKVLTVSNTLTLAGTDSTTMTFPSTNATIARTDAAQTFTGTQTFSEVIETANAITATSNAATIPVTSKNNIVTNNSAATLTLTLTTSGAVNMQECMVQILDFSAVAQTLSWVNTENSTVSVPTTSNGSTTLPLSVKFIFNSATTKWRCMASG